MHVLHILEWNLTIGKHLTVLNSKCGDAFRLGSLHFNCLIVFCRLSDSLLVGIEVASSFIANKNSVAKINFVNVRFYTLVKIYLGYRIRSRIFGHWVRENVYILNFTNFTWNPYGFPFSRHVEGTGFLTSLLTLCVVSRN